MTLLRLMMKVRIWLWNMPWKETPQKTKLTIAEGEKSLFQNLI